jgi:hypothetical protein
MLDDDAVETAAGVHAAAGDSSFRHRIRVGPMSGRSNVVHRLPECGIGVTDSRADRMFEAAQRSSRLIEDEEIETLAREG